MKTKGCAFVMGLAMLSACATKPVPQSVLNWRLVLKPYDKTWDGLVAYFATRNLQLKTIAKDSGVIYAEVGGFTQDLAYCGDIALGRRGNNAVTVNVFVQRGDNEQRVTVNTKFLQQWLDINGRLIATWECASNGDLERSILDAASAI